MLPQRIYDEFYRFLQTIDLFASSHLEQKQPHDEDGITNVLLSSLDPDYPPPGLPFTAAHFQENIKQICEDEEYAETFDFSVKHERYNKYTEGKITQSDFLLDLNYHNTQVPGDDWRSIYYVQAKKPESFFPGQLNVDTEIPYRKKQTSKIGILREAIGENGLKYALYCRPKIMTANTAVVVYNRFKVLELHELDWRSMVQSGVWMNDGAAETVYDALEAGTVTSFTFAQFIAMHYREVDDTEIIRYSTDDTSEQFRLLSQLAGFDDGAIKKIWHLTEVSGIPSERSVSALKIDVTGPGPKPAPKLDSPAP